MPKLGLEDLYMALDLAWNAAEDWNEDEPPRGQVKLGDRDVWLAALAELGMVKGQNPNGTIEIECPWTENHTDDRGGTAYLGDRFKCQHAHCVDKKTADFKAWIEQELEMAGKCLLGLLVEMTPKEDDYLAWKELESAFDPPPGGGGSSVPGSLEGLTFQDEAEAVARLIYVQAEQVFLDELTDAAMTKIEVEEALWKDAVAVAGPGGATIKRGQKSIINALLTRSELRKVHHQVYRPGLGRFIEDEYRGNLPVVNAWQKSTLAAGAPSKWLKVILDHIEGRMFIGDPLEAAVWLDWSAALVQRPSEKINWMPLIVGAGGTGKDLLFSLYSRLIGPQNLYIVGSSLIRNSFAFADAVEHHVIMIEEVLDRSHSGSGRIDIDNVLKPLIARPPHTITVRKIREKSAVVAKVANLVAFTNNIDAMSIGTEEERRRYFIYESKAVALTPSEAKTLAEAVEKGAGEFLGFLLNRDLSAWNPYATPRTAKTTRSGNRMMVAAMSGSAQRMLESIEEGELAGRNFILSSELSSIVANVRLPAREGAHAIADAMKKAGFEKWADNKQIWLSSGSQPRVWVKKSVVPKDVHEWDAAKMRVAVEAEQKVRAVERTKDLFELDDAKVVPFKKG